MAHRIMLDNNIWSYIVEADAVTELQGKVWGENIEILVPPAVVIEALQAAPESQEGKESKKRRIEAMTKSDWVRLMPEAFSEANEVLTEVKKNRPEWLKESPKLSIWKRHVADWEGPWWEFVRRNPEEASRIHDYRSDHRARRARDDSKRTREQARNTGLQLGSINLEQSAAVLIRESGKVIQSVEAWKVEAMNRWYRALNERGPDNDWFSPWIETRSIDQTSWAEFWRNAVDLTHTPLNWLRWAFGTAQSTVKANDGTPVDNQIATYLPQADVFVTADKRFADCILAVSKESPVPLPNVLRVTAPSDATTILFEHIVQCSKGRVDTTATLQRPAVDGKS